jgi:hypothetical protein
VPANGIFTWRNRAASALEEELLPPIGYTHHRTVAVCAEVRPSGSARLLVARRIRRVSAARISSGGCGTDRSSSNTYRHSTAYGCTTVNATVMNASVSYASTTRAAAIGEGIS